MTTESAFLSENERARAIFTDIVERFMFDGKPVGSRTLEKSGKFQLSSASIRNVMQDLEDLGVLGSPHTSAGRLPTDKGLRLFVDGIMEVGDLSPAERAAVEEACNVSGRSIDKVFEHASSTLSTLSQSAGLIVTSTQANKRIKHIEFIDIEPGKAMVILVAEDGSLENRPIEVDAGTTPHMLREAGDFLSKRLYDKTLSQMRGDIAEEIEAQTTEIDTLTKAVIKAGLAIELGDGKLVVRGRSHLIEESNKPKDDEDFRKLEELRELYSQLESKETISRLLSEAEDANGVKIYIGSENSIFRTSGHSLILSPYRSGQSNSIVGAIGVIGPTRLDYAKIIPSINFMAEMLARQVKP